MKKKIKIKWKNIIILTIFLISIVIFSISMYKIIKYKLDENKIKNELNNINSNTVINDVVDNDDIQLIESNTSSDDPYWDYIKMNLIDVDFGELKSINNEVKGWIYVNGTNINYPFVQHSDNKYYLTHSFDKSYNIGGWVFLDYRNDISNLDSKNIIIYAHGMKNNTMFGTLKNVIKSSWLDNSNNHIIKLSNEYENSLWQVFSVYTISTTSDYLKTNFSDNNDFLNFINMLINRSIYDFKTNVSDDDKIITLSSCYNNSDKVVLHAKLIKRQIK